MKSFRSTIILSICTVLVLPNCLKTQHEMTTRATQEQPMIKLFVYQSCPFCHKVINFLKSIDKLDQVTIVDAGKYQNLKELRDLNHGNTQCPFLYDMQRNVKMLESSDIIAYLKNRF